MSSNYERELRDILMGEEETIEKITKTMAEEPTHIYRRCMDKPFLIMRGAGSLGIDLFANRGRLFFAIEEKASTGKMYFTDDDRLPEQHKQFEDYAENRGMPYIYAKRSKGKSGEKWYVFRTEKSPIARMVTDVSQIPFIPETVHGNKYLYHEDGIPLSKFLTLLKGDGMDD